MGDKAKIFISYSRQDVGFADQLLLVLDDQGFETIIDRHAIDAAEAWQERLGKLILSADTVVFVLTPASAGSPICAWEVEEAVRLGKRVIPVLPARLENADPPKALAALNYIQFYDDPSIPGSGFYDGQRKLVSALSTDIGWLRQQTRLAELAADWQARGRPESLLLRDPLLSEAQDWLATTPAGEAVPDLIRTMINASVDAARTREALAKAQVAEREEALKAAEEATDRSQNLANRLRRFAIIGMVFGGLLAAVAIYGNWYATKQTLKSNDLQADLFASEANALSEAGDQPAAMLLALLGDPSADRSWASRWLRPEGNPSVRAALERAYTSNRVVTSSVLEDSDIIDVQWWDDVPYLISDNFGEVKIYTQYGENLYTIRLPDVDEYESMSVAYASIASQRVLFFGSKGGQENRHGEMTLMDFSGDIITRLIVPRLWDFSELSEDGDYVVLADDDLITIYSATNGKLLRTIKIADSNYISAVSFDPASDKILILSDAGLDIRSFSDDQFQSQIDIGNSDWDQLILSKLTPDTVILVSYGGKYGRLDLVDGAFLGEVIDLDAEVNKIHLIEDKNIAVIENDGTIEILEIRESPRKILKILMSDGTTFADFNVHSNLLAVWNDNTARFHDLSESAELMARISGSDSRRRTDFFERATSYTGRWDVEGRWRAFLTIPENGVSRIMFHDLLKQKIRTGQIKIGGETPMWAYQFDIDSIHHALALGRENASISIWEIDQEEPIEVFDIMHFQSTQVTADSSTMIGNIKFDPTGGYLAVLYQHVDDDQFLTGVRFMIWERGVSEPFAELDTSLVDGTIHFTWDGLYIILISHIGEVEVWDWKNNKLVSQFEGVGRNNIQIVSHRTRPIFAVASYDGLMQVWDYLDGKRLSIFSTDRVFSMSFHPEQEFLATTHYENNISVWRVSEKTRAPSFVLPKVKREFGATFSKDGSLLTFSEGFNNRAETYQRKLSPFLFEDIATQTVMACDALKIAGLHDFDDDYRARQALLRDREIEAVCAPAE